MARKLAKKGVFVAFSSRRLAPDLQQGED